MTSGRDEYNLTPYFLTPLQTASAVDYRHQILHDLEEEDVRAAVDGYARGLRTMRAYLALIGKLRDKYQRERWFSMRRISTARARGHSPGRSPGWS